MIHQFALLKDSEIKALIPDVTLVIFPVGGLEQHGSHLPVGTKLIQCRDYSKTFAEKLHKNFPAWNFLLMPPLPFTVDTYTSAMAIQVRPHVVRDALVDQCESLKKIGFRNFAALSAHLSPRQLCAIEDAGKIVSKKGASLVSLSSGMINRSRGFESPMIALPEEHAGAFDTGYLLAVHPELVSTEALQLASVRAPKPSPSRLMDYFRGKVEGYWGDPSSADSSQAIKKMDREFDLLLEKLRPVLEKGVGHKEFLSIYRFFPFNGSFFKAYLLALIFFMSLLIWTILGVRNVFQ
jgi:creatinine amidohydrolase